MWALKERIIAAGAGLLALFLLYHTLVVWIDYGGATNTELLKLAHERDECQRNHDRHCQVSATELMFNKLGAKCEAWFWCFYEVGDDRLEATAHDNVAKRDYRSLSRHSLLFGGLAAVTVACLVSAFFQARAWDSEKAAKREKHNLPQKKKNY